MLTTEKQAQKQPPFKESVTAHWFSFFALKMFRTKIIYRSYKFSSENGSRTFCMSKKFYNDIKWRYQK